LRSAPRDQPIGRNASRETPEIAGVNGTFEQLGNAIGVALVGTMMLATLAGGLSQSVAESDVLPPQAKAPLEEAVENGIELMSDTQIEIGLDAAGADEATRQEVERIYGEERIAAFRAGVLFLIFLGLMALVVTTGLPDRMLIEGRTP
jgi:hypothetical protein